MAQLKQAAILYKMVFIYILLFSFNSLTTATVATLLNSNWSEMSTTNKFLAVVVILQNWTGVLLAFFNKSIQRAEQGKPIIPIDPSSQTQMWQKEAVVPPPGTPPAPKP